MTFFGRTPAASPEFTPPATVQSIAVLGAGSWGTAFAKIAADAARERGDDTRVTLIGRDEQVMAECERTRENARYFPGMKLPDNMHFTADAPAALAGADIVVLALPAQVLRSQLQSFARYIEPNAMLVSLAKGLETGTVCACRRSLPRNWKNPWLCVVLICARLVYSAPRVRAVDRTWRRKSWGGAYRLRGCGSYPAGG